MRGTSGSAGHSSKMGEEASARSLRQSWEEEEEKRAESETPKVAPMITILFTVPASTLSKISPLPTTPLRLRCCHSLLLTLVYAGVCEVSLRPSADDVIDHLSRSSSLHTHAVSRTTAINARDESKKHPGAQHFSKQPGGISRF